MRLMGLALLLALLAAGAVQAQEAQAPKVGGWTVVEGAEPQVPKIGGWAILTACAAVPKIGGWVILQSWLEELSPIGTAQAQWWPFFGGRAAGAPGC